MAVVAWLVIVTYVEIENGDDHGGSTGIGDNYQRGKPWTTVLVSRVQHWTLGNIYIFVQILISQIDMMNLRLILLI